MLGLTLALEEFARLRTRPRRARRRAGVRIFAGGVGERGGRASYTSPPVAATSP